MIFFGNINHIPADLTTNASVQKTRNDTFTVTNRYKNNATTIENTTTETPSKKAFQRHNSVAKEKVKSYDEISKNLA